MRKIKLFIAMSLDGYIADKDGSVNWLEETGETGGIDSYDKFIKNIDTVVIGWNTYKQIVDELSPDIWPYEGMKSYVLTHRKKVGNRDDIVFTDKNIVDLLNEIRSEDGKDIWICGGAKVVKQIHNENLIDEYHLSIMPVILGDGVSLFENAEKSFLKLKSSNINGNTIEVIYTK